MLEGFLVGAVVGYLIGIFLAGVVMRSGSGWARTAASVVTGLTWLGHTAAVVGQAVATASLPLSNMTEYLLVLGWAVMTLHLYIWFRLRVHVAGLVLPQHVVARACVLAAHEFRLYLCEESALLALNLVEK